MTPVRRPDWYTTVRRHWRRTTGLILAEREPCIKIRDQEVAAVKGRVVVARTLDELERWTPPTSWIAAVLVCPGDKVQGVVDWFRPLKADPTRVWFYLHPDTGHRALKPWDDAGYDTDQVDYVASWQELHKLFGLALNDRVYADWKGLASKRERRV